MMSDKSHFVIFTLDDQRFAVPLDVIDKIVRAVDILPIPKAPDVIQGIINIQGRIIPVVNLRKRFRIADKSLSIDDHLIIGRSAKRTLAILVDTVQDIVESQQNEIVAPDEILDEMQHIKGVMKLENGMILIHDLEHVLSEEEDSHLEKALQTGVKSTKRAKKADSLRADAS